MTEENIAQVGTTLDAHQKKSDALPIEFFFIFPIFFAFIIYFNIRYFKRWHRMSDALEKIANSLQEISQKLDKK